MIYYAIKNSDGKYWDGGEKLCSPPILICESTEAKTALVCRSKAEMENKASKSARHDDYEVVVLDSADFSHLAD